MREIVEACAAGRGGGRRRPQDRRPVRQLHGRGPGQRARQHPAPGRCSPRSTPSATCDELAAFLGEFERRGGGGLFGSYVDTDDRNSDRYLVNLVQGGIGLPDESYYREEKFAEIRAKYVDYLEKMLDPRRPTRRRGRPPRPCSRWRPGSPRVTGSAPRPATSSRPTTSRRTTSCARCCRPSTWTPTSATSAATSADPRRDDRARAVLPRPPRGRARRHRPRALAGVPGRSARSARPRRT